MLFRSVSDSRPGRSLHGAAHKARGGSRLPTDPFRLSARYLDLSSTGEVAEEEGGREYGAGGVGELR